MESFIIKILRGMIGKLISGNIGELIALLQRIFVDVNGTDHEIDSKIDEVIKWIKENL